MTEIDQFNWEEVYYDPADGDFVVIEVQDDEIKIWDAFNGIAVETFSHEEFDSEVSDELIQLHPEVIESPVKFLEQAIGAARAGDFSTFRNQDVNVDFAIRAVDVVERNSYYRKKL